MKTLSLCLCLCLNDDVFAHYCSPGKIKDLLVQNVVDGSTILVLVNAIYFKGNWNQQFKEDSTVDAQFRINKVTLHKTSTGWKNTKGQKQPSGPQFPNPDNLG